MSMQELAVPNSGLDLGFGNSFLCRTQLFKAVNTTTPAAAGAGWSLWGA